MHSYLFVGNWKIKLIGKYDMNPKSFQHRIDYDLILHLEFKAMEKITILTQDLL